MYSSGLVSQSFWFVEMKKIIKLVSECKDEHEIRKICIEENLFGAAKEYRAKRIYGYLWKRVKTLDETTAIQNKLLFYSVHRLISKLSFVIHNYGKYLESYPHVLDMLLLHLKKCGYFFVFFLPFYHRLCYN